MKAKIIKADSGTTKYLYACMKFSENEVGREYPNETITCIDITGNHHSHNFAFIKDRQKKGMNGLHRLIGDALYDEEINLANFITENFDELKDVEEISPRDWDRVINEKPKEESPFKDVEKYVPENIAKLLDDDLFASRMIGRNIKNGLAPENALEIYVNSVEGDTTQLPESLAKYARKKGWLKGFE